MLSFHWDKIFPYQYSSRMNSNEPSAILTFSRFYNQLATLSNGNVWSDFSSTFDTPDVILSEQGANQYEEHFVQAPSALFTTNSILLAWNSYILLSLFIFQNFLERLLYYLHAQKLYTCFDTGLDFLFSFQETYSTLIF